jgi:outer membrane lipoprotein-sorting protein
MILKAGLTLLAFACLFLHAENLEAAAGDEDRILAVAQNMEAAFEKLKDYTCEVEQVFYQNGEENQRYVFKFYFKKEKKIRVDFSQPHSGLTIFYNDNDKDKEATIRPFRSLSPLKFRLSIDNPLLKTLAGQRINQTDMGYFIKFILKNLGSVEQKGSEFREDGERIEFLFWALDYIEEKSPEKYRISISRKYWLPIRIERFNLEDKRLEVTDIRNYVLDAHLGDKFFLP